MIFSVTKVAFVAFLCRSGRQTDCDQASKSNARFHFASVDCSSSKLESKLRLSLGNDDTGDDDGMLATQQQSMPFDDHDDSAKGNLPGVLLSEKNKGVLVLLTVPMAWGTFEPAVRLVYQYDPTIPPFLFSFAYYTAAAGVLALLSSRSTSFTTSSENDSDSHGDDHHQSLLAVQGGTELGTYLFLGNALQVIGLKTVPSDRAAFLLQLTTVFVPLVQSLLARNLSIVPPRTWAACVIALCGVALIGLDGSNGQEMTATLSSSVLDTWDFALGKGDLLIILGALFYTFHCIRLEKYAKNTSALQLAAAKATTETAWSGLVLVVCFFAVTFVPPQVPGVGLARDSGNNLLSYLVQSSSFGGEHWYIVALATLWTGLVTVAYTIYAQSYGQSRVPAASANLIYTIQPLFTAAIAFLLLGESLGVYGYAGGALIGASVLLVVANEDI
mmetsp:Transcript_17514/g.31605  ORF Transcript_17514/g.31605 Transcript_17514/m.31605 type:complete len:444 (-) Transcript_17514:175-1506(-)